MSLTKDEILELAKKAGINPFSSFNIASPKSVERFAKALTDPLQAKIDSLMWEYCPDEMTQEQKDNWAKHQKRSMFPEYFEEASINATQ